MRQSGIRQGGHVSLPKARVHKGKIFEMSSGSIMGFNHVDGILIKEVEVVQTLALLV